MNFARSPVYEGCPEIGRPSGGTWAQSEHKHSTKNRRACVRLGFTRIWVKESLCMADAQKCSDLSVWIWPRNFAGARRRDSLLHASSTPIQGSGSSRARTTNEQREKQLKRDQWRARLYRLFAGGKWKKPAGRCSRQKTNSTVKRRWVLNARVVPYLSLKDTQR